MTGVPFSESWTASVIIGRRLLETAIPPYQALAEAAAAGTVSDRTVLIVSYALSGFAHLASVGIFVGGTIALIPSRRKDISELGWKALFIGTLATMMIACLAGVFDTGDPTILGDKTSPAQIAPITPGVSPSPSVTVSPIPLVAPISPKVAPVPTAPPTTKPPAAKPRPTTGAAPKPATQVTPKPTGAAPKATTPNQQRSQPKPTASPVPSPVPQN